METLQGHFYQWGAVAFFILLYAIAILFLPFRRKVERKPTAAYLAFVVAFAVEMHGIPFSMYLVSWIFGKTLPEGVFWGHTLYPQVGHLGMFLNIGCALIALPLVISGWRSIHRQYWSKDSGAGQVVRTGIYRYIRHPQYTGFMLLTLGMLLEWATLPLLFMWPFIVWMYYRLAKREERDMLAEFGEEYAQYMDRTTRFIPFVV